jgi:hypothetical protein
MGKEGSRATRRILDQGDQASAGGDMTPQDALASSQQRALDHILLSWEDATLTSIR